MKTRGLALLLALAPLAAPAYAIDSLTGTYEGKASCKGVFGDVATKVKYDIEIRLSEQKDGVVMTTFFEGAMGSDLYRSYHVEVADKPDRAKIGGVTCTLATEADVTGIALQGDVVIKPGSAKGTIKGTYTLYSAPPILDACTFSVKRTSTAPPKVIGCVP